MSSITSSFGPIGSNFIKEGESKDLVRQRLSSRLHVVMSCRLEPCRTFHSSIWISLCKSEVRGHPLLVETQGPYQPSCPLVPDPRPPFPQWEVARMVNRVGQIKQFES